MTIRAVIFDFDGTLVRTSGILITVWQRVGRAFGEKIERRDIKRSFGSSAAAIARKFLRRANKNRVTQLFQSLYKERVASTRAIPRMARTMAALKRKGYKIAVASGSYHSYVRPKLKRIGLLPYIDVVLGGDDYRRPKPAPDAFVAAARLLRVKRSECLVVGDSVYDMDAARAVGMHRVGVMTGTSTKKDLVNAGAKMIISSAAAVQKALRALNQR